MASLEVVCMAAFVLLSLATAGARELRCEMEVSEREDCGYPGIGAGECFDSECCYNRSHVPWCFTEKEWIKSGPQTNGKEYFLSIMRKDWGIASKVCRQKNWLLTTMTNEEDRNIVVQFVEKEQEKGQTWIGLRLDHDHEYGIWSDGTVFDSSEGDWAPGQPNHGGGECVALSNIHDYLMDNRDCYQKKQYVCEAESNWIASGPQSNGKTYFMSKTKRTWNYARKYCVTSGWILATLKSEEENVIVVEFVGREQELGYTWIGLELNPGYENGTWSDGSPFQSSNGYWAPNEPNANGGSCVALSKEWEYLWDNRDCSEHKYFVCEAPTR